MLRVILPFFKTRQLLVFSIDTLINKIVPSFNEYRITSQSEEKFRFLPRANYNMLTTRSNSILERSYLYCKCVCRGTLYFHTEDVIPSYQFKFKNISFALP